MQNNVIPKLLAIVLSVALATTSLGIAFADEIEDSNESTQGAIESAESDMPEATSVPESVTVDESAVLAITPQAGTVVITSESELDPYFPDPVFRDVVFAAVKDGGKDGTAVGTGVLDALNNYRGKIYHNNAGKPDNPMIYDVHGIEYLRNAENINLKYNRISDLSWLEKSDDAGKTWYGSIIAADPDVDIDGKNVEWDFGGNPLEKIPTTFGGRLKIIAPQSSSYTYAQNTDPLLGEFVYARFQGGPAFAATVKDVAKTKVYSAGIEDRWAHLDNCVPYFGMPGDTDVGMKVASHTDTTANLTGIGKSGTEHLSVGTEAELRYKTQDEYANITPGAQSHKYYLTYTFRIYDKLTASSASAGSVELTKKDEATGAVLAGAEYKVFKDDGTEVVPGKTYTTDANGKVKVDGLVAGSYYFQEVSAPDGYRLSEAKTEFTINAPIASGVLPSTTAGGGESSIKTTDQGTINAQPGEALFVSGKDGAGNLLGKDITLTSSDTSMLRGVEVTYENLYMGGKTVRTFASLADAEADINRKKADNAIGGAISVKGFYADPTATPIAVTATDKAVEKIDIDVTKEWYDNPTYWQVGDKHPDIVIHLLRNGKEVDRWELAGELPSPGGRDTYRSSDYGKFKGLPKTDQNGKDYVYTVTEDEVNSLTFPHAPYGTEIAGNATTGFTVANRWLEGAYFHVKGEKVWDDCTDTTRPEALQLVLTRIDSSGAETTNEATVTPVNGRWEFSFKHLDKWEDQAAGKVYTYILSEKDVEGYTSFDPVTIPLDAATVDTSTIDLAITNPGETTNVFDNEAGTFEGEKVWIGDKEIDRPVSVDITLMQDGVDYKTVTTDAVAGWKYRFTNLPLCDVATGDLYVYTVKETVVPRNYTSVVDQPVVTGSTTTGSITNTFDNDIVSVSIEKTWDGDENDLAHRPKSVEVTLLQNGKAYGQPYVVAVLDDANDWKATITGLPKYDASGKAYAYSFEEEPVAGYKAIQSSEQSADGTEWKISLINQRTVIKIEGEKKWVDNLGYTGVRPDVTFRLFRDGVEVPEKVVTILGTRPTPGEKFVYGFTNLQRFDAGDGHEYVYEVKEDPVRSKDDPEGYVSSVVGFEITNRWVVGAIFTIEGTKTWDDSDNRQKKRPEQITLVLKQDGVEYATATTSEALGWKYRFEDLPKWKDEASGKLYTYTLEEVPVKGYISFSPVTVPLTEQTAEKETISLDPAVTVNRLAAEPHDPSDPSGGSKKLAVVGDDTGTLAVSVLGLGALAGGIVSANARRRRKS